MEPVSNTTLTIGALLALSGVFWSVVWGVLRAQDWLNKKIEASIQPIAIKMSAIELRVETQGMTMTEFKIAVGQGYASNKAIGHLEERMDEGFRGIRTEMSDVRDLLMREFAQRTRGAGG